MSLPLNIKVVPLPGSQEIIFEVWKKGKFIYAINHDVNGDGVERWNMTDETFDPTVKPKEIASIGAAIEDMYL